MKRLRVANREYLITEYAARRMAMRGISPADACGVLGYPTRVRPSVNDPHRLVLQRTMEGRRLVVVVEGIPGLEPWDVVTAWVEGQDE